MTLADLAALERSKSNRWVPQRSITASHLLFVVPVLAAVLVSRASRSAGPADHNLQCKCVRCTAILIRHFVALMRLINDHVKQLSRLFRTFDKSVHSWSICIQTNTLVRAEIARAIPCSLVRQTSN